MGLVGGTTLTHLHYAFGAVSADGECEITAEQALHDDQKPYDDTQSLDGLADKPEQALAGTFNQIKKLKARYGLRTSISLGGGSGSRHFAAAALTPDSRKKFVQSCIKLYLKGPKVGPVPDLESSTESISTGSPRDRLVTTRSIAPKKSITSPCCCKNFVASWTFMANNIALGEWYLGDAWQR